MIVLRYIVLIIYIFGGYDYSINFTWNPPLSLLLFRYSLLFPIHIILSLYYDIFVIHYLHFRCLQLLESHTTITILHDRHTLVIHKRHYFIDIILWYYSIIVIPYLHLRCLQLLESYFTRLSYCHYYLLFYYFTVYCNMIFTFSASLTEYNTPPSRITRLLTFSCN